MGLGAIGADIARAALEDSRVILVGVADLDQSKAARDLGEVIGKGRLGVIIDEDVREMLSRTRPEVTVVTVSSAVEVIGPVLETCVSYGSHVVTTCENLADGESAQLDPGFDERARKAGVVVLATGVNPGFAMDRLPVMLAQATRNIRRIRVSRVVNASTRRTQLQAKIGVGVSPSDFAEGVKNGTIGHAGLSASLRLVAKGVGIGLDKTTEVFSPVVAATSTHSSHCGDVIAGSVRGIYQIARGFKQSREVITLELTMALDELAARDTIDIVGEPPIHFSGELPGDSCTVATVLSAIVVVVNMQPGLKTVLDVPLEQPEEPSTSIQTDDVSTQRISTLSIEKSRFVVDFKKIQKSCSKAKQARRAKKVLNKVSEPTVRELKKPFMGARSFDGTRRIYLGKYVLVRRSLYQGRGK